MSASATRTTLSLRPAARRIARQRAESKSISLGEAVSELIEEAERYAPKTRLETRNGWPVLIPPPGTPKLTAKMVKDMLEDEG